MTTTIYETFVQMWVIDFEIGIFGKSYFQSLVQNGQQMQMITKQLGNQMTMMKQIQQTLTILAKGSQAQPTAPTVNTDTNGGNN